MNIVKERGDTMKIELPTEEKNPFEVLDIVKVYDRSMSTRQKVIQHIEGDRIWVYDDYGIELTVHYKQCRKLVDKE